MLRRVSTVQSAAAVSPRAASCRCLRLHHKRDGGNTREINEGFGKQSPLYVTLEMQSPGFIGAAALGDKLNFYLEFDVIARKVTIYASRYYEPRVPRVLR